MRHALFQLLLIATFLAATPALRGQGTLVYHNPPDIHLFTAGTAKSHDLDLNGDGIVDYRVVVTGGDFTAYGRESNASMTLPESPPDLGAYILPLPTDAYVGPSLMPATTWFETYSFEPLPGIPVTVPAIFHGCTNIGCGSDPFHNVTAYWGVQFEIGNNTHYGWVQVATPGGIRNGGTILDWAYNTIPGQPILAGQVPEPATWVLLIGGGLMLVSVRRRRTRT